jgi:hypothetical protein
MKSAYSEALRQARADLSELQRRFDDEKYGLETVIAALEMMASLDRGDSAVIISQVPAAPSWPGGKVWDAFDEEHEGKTIKGEAPLWQRIEAAMKTRKQPFTVSEVIEALAQGGFNIDSENRVRIVRNAMVQKDEIFGKVGRGLFVTSRHVPGMMFQGKGDQMEEATEVAS